MKSLIAAALGERPGTLLLENIMLANVITREFQPHQAILVYEDLIVAVGPTNEFDSSQASEVVDGSGLIASPSFVDCHLHIESSMLSLENFAKVAVPSGTGGIVIDPHELVNVGGVRALEWLRESSHSLAALLNVWLEIPSCVPATPFETAGATLTAENIVDLLKKTKDSNIVGLAEMMNYPGVLSRDNQVLEKIAAALATGKIVEGHAPGLTGRDLCGYLVAGVESDHEATTGEEALEKLRRGMKIQIRYGSLAKDLEAIVPTLADRKIDSRYCMVVSDDRHPHELLEKGHLNGALQECVRLGIDPLEALQWVTINPITHLRLSHKYGSIAPGKKANITLLSSLSNYSLLPELVIHQGKIVAKEGRLLIPIPEPKPPEEFLNTVQLKRKLTVKDFQLVTGVRSGEVDAKVIGVQEGSLLTNELTKKVKTDDLGIIQPHEESDTFPIAVVERHGHVGNVSVGLVSGFGFRNGAIASTVAHDSHNIIVVGTNAELMLKATNELTKLSGGICAINKEKQVALPLPICGLLSLRTAEEVSVQMDRLMSFVANEIGTSLKNPLMTLSFLALPVIPALKITDKGLFDVTKFEFVEVLDV
ncbi:MAG: adenine deaminase [Candidatus Hodarchaeota archaeon]